MEKEVEESNVYVEAGNRLMGEIFNILDVLVPSDLAAINSISYGTGKTQKQAAMDIIRNAILRTMRELGGDVK